MSLGDYWAFFGVNPKGAVDGMNVAKKAVRSGSKDISSSLSSIKGIATKVFVGWGVYALGKEFIQAAMDIDSMTRSMSAAVGGMDKANREINYLRKTSMEMGLSFQDAGKDFKMLAAAAKGTALEGDGVRKVWRSLQNATVALQLTTAETSGTVYAFKDMLSKGTVQAEELKRQLGNRLPGAFNMAAKAMGMTTRELAKQMKLGNIMTDDFLPALAKAMDDTFGKAAIEASKSMKSELVRMKTAWFDFKTVFMEVSGLTRIVGDGFKFMTKKITEMTDYLLKNEKKIKTFFVELSGYAQEFGVRVTQGFENLVGFAEWISSDMEKAKQIIPILAKSAAQVFIEAFTNVSDATAKAVSGKFGRKLLLATFSPVLNADAYPYWEKVLGLDKASQLENISKTIEDSFSEFAKSVATINEDLKKELEAKGLDGYFNELTKKFEKNSEKAQNKINAITKKILAAKARIANEPGMKYKRSLMPEEDLVDPTKIKFTKWEQIFIDLKASFEKLSAQSTDIAKNIESVFTSAFKGIEDAFAQMVTKGKIDWRSLADSMLADMARLAARQAVTGPLQKALGVGMNALANWAGPGSGVGNQPSVSQIAPVGQTPMATIKMANGGMINEHIIGTGQSTGRQYEMGENGSEAVLNKNQIRNLSKNKQSVVSVTPVINISTPPGTQATTQSSGDGMNMDVMITMVEKAISSNMRRGSGLSDTMQQMYGLNRSSGAMR